MSFDFVKRPISTGFFEPEGVYLEAPFEGRRRLALDWGLRPEQYHRYAPGGQALHGHEGVDFELSPNAKIFAADRGVVAAISNDPERFGSLLRLAHPWGESLYTRFQSFVVEAGQQVERGELLGYFLRNPGPDEYFHFGIRIASYDISDGWGGYVNPLPHLPPDAIIHTRRP